MSELVVIMGGVCSGKTILRKRKYQRGYVNVDAADIFLQLGPHEFANRTPALQKQLEVNGKKMALDAISAQKNIAIEIIGNNQSQLLQLINKIKAIGYTVKIVGVTCSAEDAVERNKKRDGADISSYFIQDYHVQWLIKAIDTVSVGNR